MQKKKADETYAMIIIRVIRVTLLKTSIITVSDHCVEKKFQMLHVYNTIKKDA